MRDDIEFDAWAAARYKSLLHVAFLLTGDRESAQDLVQTALVKTHLAWKRVEQSPDAYVRRVMVTTRTDWWRRQAWREEATADVPEMLAADDERVDQRDALTRALQSLSPRQRTLVVLRHYLQLSEAECADLLGCSIGTVKSTTSRALDRLRQSPSLTSLQEMC